MYNAVNMEGAPFFPEIPDDDEESTSEKEDKKDEQPKRLLVFERLLKEDKQDEEDKKPSEWFANDKAKKEAEQAETVDKEPPLETLADDEKQQAVEQYIEARTDEVKQELSEVSDDTPAEAVALANAALLENIQEKLDEGNPVDEETLDEMVEETVAELGLEAAAREGEPDDVDLPEDDPEDPTDDTATPASAAPASTSVPPPPPPATPGTPPSVPPPPPRSSTMPGGTGAVPRLTPNSAPQPHIVEVRNRRHEAANLLVGGIVGYMIGRRGGRLRTEAKLLPVQEKLKKEVNDLHDMIAIREEKIRKLTYAQTVEQPMVLNKVAERLERKAVSEKPVGQPAIQPERLGRFAVFGEQPPDRRTAEQRPKSVDTMTMPELLAIASNIQAEQASAKRLYETGRLNDEGLRRVVRAYLRGERVEAVLRDNIKAPESLVSHEAQPGIQAGQQHTSPAQTTSTAASLIAQHLDDPKPYEAYKLPSDYQPTTASHAKRKSNNATIIVGTATITLVFLIILLLAL